MNISDFEQIESLNYYDSKIVYQGEEGAYTEEAMFQFFGVDINYFNVPSWRDAFDAVRNGDAKYGVVPFENSTAGIISENYDLLREYGFYIVGEQILSIDHCLLGVKGASLSDIKTVYSHPQAFSQCSSFFLANRQMEKMTVLNTAIAAKNVSAYNDITKAAVAGHSSAKHYGLSILKEAIQNNKENRTRFIVIGNSPVYVKGAGKISIGLQLKNEAGSLYRALSVFHRYNINMTSIESRPIPERTWEYFFFIDLEGSIDTEKIQIAFEVLKKESAELILFGNY